MDIPLPPSPGGARQEEAAAPAEEEDRYSPSHITSDNDDDDVVAMFPLPVPPPPPPPKHSRKPVDSPPEDPDPASSLLPEGIPLPAPPPTKPKVLPPTSLLGGQRAKQRLRAFAAAKGGQGNVSFGLHKLSRTLKRSAKFEEEEDFDKERAEDKGEETAAAVPQPVEEDSDQGMLRNLPPAVAAAARNIDAMMGVTSDKSPAAAPETKDALKVGKEERPSSASGRRRSRTKSPARTKSGSRKRSRSREQSRSSRRSDVDRRRSRSKERSSKRSRRSGRSRSRDRGRGRSSAGGGSRSPPRKWSEYIDRGKMPANWAELKDAGVDVGPEDICKLEKEVDRSLSGKKKVGMFHSFFCYPGCSALPRDGAEPLFLELERTRRAPSDCPTWPLSGGRDP